MTASLEDYLEAIYFVSKEKEDVRITDIADFLSVKKSSVNQAIKTLAENEMIIYKAYSKLILTKKRT